MAGTKIVTKINADKIPREYLIRNKRGICFDKWLKKVDKAVNEFSALAGNNWEEIENKPFIYVNKKDILVGNSKRKKFPTDRVISALNDIPVRALNLDEHDWLFGKKLNENPLINEGRYLDNKGELFNYVWYNDSPNYWYKGYTNQEGRRDWWSSFQNRSDTVFLPVADVEKNRLEFFIKNALIFNNLSSDSKKVFDSLFKLYKQGKLAEIKENKIKFDDSLMQDALDKKLDFIDGMSFDEKNYDVSTEEDSVKLSDELISKLFLECDKMRAGIEPYDKKRIEDINLGHWDLWHDNSENGTFIDLSGKLVGRDPSVDIRHDGVVGIDFGTKSTVVVYQDGSDLIKPMRIGSGKFKEKIDRKSYENPTVMEFIDLESFIKAFKENDGRPSTKYEHLMISHAAQADLDSNTISGDDYYAFFNDIKQWANDKRRQVIIKDKKKHEYVLPAFKELKDEDTDPVEVYAYILGLFINNMYNGIFMNYIMSFPTTYERSIRDKLLKSFRSGLRKSLPQIILDNKELMEEFRVVQGASEPAAYAVCALTESEYAASESSVFYGIFDFGGGTTDYDFGVWKNADEKIARRYDNVICHFGDGGDSLLGGENLLEMMSFLVFADNKDKLLENDISFYKPAEAESFPGSERLLINSQEAKLNTRKMMEKLCPFWEGGGEGLKEAQKVNLYKNDGSKISGLELRIDEEMLNKYLEGRIRQGVRNFFEAMLLAFNESNASDAKQIVIFLAGNSSRSSYVPRLFDECKAEFAEKLITKLNLTGADADNFFVLQPPLGYEQELASESREAEEAIDDIKFEALEAVDETKAEPADEGSGNAAETDAPEEDIASAIVRPNAKTGVAFGLLKCMPGSRIKVESEKGVGEEIKFRYYLGLNIKGKFYPVVDRNTDYNKWIEFIDASENDFEIYYSDLPIAATGNMNAYGVPKKLCRLIECNDEAMVYVRIKAPSVIEYVASLPANLERGEYLADPLEITLGKE